MQDSTCLKQALCHLDIIDDKSKTCLTFVVTRIKTVQVQLTNLWEETLKKQL